MEKMFIHTGRHFEHYERDEIDNKLKSGWTVKSVTMASSGGEFLTIIVLEKKNTGGIK